MSDEQNETNVMWREFKRQARERSKKMQVKDAAELAQAIVREEIEAEQLRGDGSPWRIWLPSAPERRLTIYLTRGTIVTQAGVRLHQKGVRAAINFLKRSAKEHD